MLWGHRQHRLEPRIAWRRLRRAAWLRSTIPHLVVLLLVATVGLLGVLTPIEHALMDLRFGLAGRSASGNIVIVEIDHKSLQELSVWPWPRSYHAEILDRLTAAGAQGIAFDVDFSAQSTPPADAALAAAIADAQPRVVLPVFKQYTSPSRNPDDVRFTGPLPQLTPGARLASVNLQPGADGLIRLYGLGEQWDGQTFPAMAAALAPPTPPRAAAFYLDYGIAIDSVPHYSYVDVLKGRVDPTVFAGKQVIIGATSVELGDHFAVPLYRTWPGVALQALAFESIAQDRMLLRSSPALTWLLAALLAVVVGPRFSRWRRPLGLVVVLGGAVALFGISAVVQAWLPLSLDTAAWMLVLALSYVATLVLDFDRLAKRMFRKGMALMQRNAMMRSLLEDSFDGIVIAGDNGRVELVNPAAAALLGADADTLVGRDAETLFEAAADAAPSDHENNGRPALRTTRLRRPDGGFLPVEFVVCRSVIRQGRHRLERRDSLRTVTIYTFRDIAERQRAEAAQREALAAAVAANRAKTEFIANMGHELRTPLNAIIGFSEIIKEQMFGAVGHEHYIAYAADIHKSGTRLLTTINGVLEMARIEGGRYQLEETAVDLGDIVDDAMGAVADAAGQKTLSIERRIHPDLPPLRADARALRQVLVSLLSNAVKFTGPGGKVAIEGAVDAAGHCLVSVADTGIGMSEDQLGGVVRPFHQADSSLARKYEGSGLGLSLAAGLMSLHGGSLDIASRPGSGTTVTLRFPAERLLAA